MPRIPAKPQLPDLPPTPTPPTPPPDNPPQRVTVIQRRIETRSVELQLGEPNGYQQGHLRIDAQALRPAQRLGLARLLYGLRDTHAMTDDGKPVQDGSQAIRWLLERIAAC